MASSEVSKLAVAFFGAGMVALATTPIFAQEESIRLPSGRILQLPASAKAMAPVPPSLPTSVADEKSKPMIPANSMAHEKVLQNAAPKSQVPVSAPAATDVPKPAPAPKPAVKPMPAEGWQVLNRVDAKTKKTLEVTVYWQHGERIPFNQKLVQTCCETIDKSIIDSERRNSLNLLARIENWQIVPAAAQTLRNVCLNDYDTEMRWAGVRMLTTIPNQQRLVTETMAICARFESEAVIRDFCISHLQQNPTSLPGNPKR